MVQRINVTDINLFGSSDTFEYCLSFLVQGQENLVVELTFIDDNPARHIKISPSKSNEVQKNFVIIVFFILV